MLVVTKSLVTTKWSYNVWTTVQLRIRRQTVRTGLLELSVDRPVVQMEGELFILQTVAIRARLSLLYSLWLFVCTLIICTKQRSLYFMLVRGWRVTHIKEPECQLKTWHRSISMSTYIECMGDAMVHFVVLPLDNYSSNNFYSDNCKLYAKQVPKNRPISDSRDVWCQVQRHVTLFLMACMLYELSVTYGTAQIDFNQAQQDSKMRVMYSIPKLKYYSALWVWFLKRNIIHYSSK